MVGVDSGSAQAAFLGHLGREGGFEHWRIGEIRRAQVTGDGLARGVPELLGRGKAGSAHGRTGRIGQRVN